MTVRAIPPELLARRRTRERNTRRWALKKLDRDLMEAAVLVQTWGEEGGDAGEIGDVDEETDRLVADMSRICDVAMPRVRRLPPRRAAYWWTEEIANLRRSSVRHGRTYRRARAGRRGVSEEEAGEAWRAARQDLARAIFAAKDAAWKELIASVEEDPWGRPYKLVKNKLRPWAPPLTESLDPQFVDRVVSTLFPVGDGGDVRFPEIPRWEWDDELGVTEEELARALRRVRRGKAPGPDGIPGRMWTLAAGGLAGRMRRLYTACLRAGRFPTRWKRASLVLLPKAGKPEDSPSGYRPVCLLDEAGKVLERIIAERLVQHLSRRGKGGLSEDQFGFRAGRSTVDAIKRVLARTEAEIEEGRVVMGVSFDVKNAFNSLPWPVLGEALLRFGVPPYLVQMVLDYFRERGMVYTDRDGILRIRLMGCGVPQGSVLGPLLWIIGYDLVLRTPLPLRCWLSGYADDVYLGVSGEGWEELTRLAEAAAACVVRSIRRLGLEVAPQKTEVTVFYDKKRGHIPPPEGLSLRVEGVDVPATPHQKYLGVWLDGQRSFGEHVARVTGKAVGAANALARILPNIGGASGRVRRLYVAAVQSVLLYAAPVWWRKVGNTTHLRERMAAAQRKILLKAARAYRTVSHVGAGILAGTPPVHLVAEGYAQMYDRTKAIKANSGVVTARARGMLKLQIAQSVTAKWKEYLLDARLPSVRLREAVQPILEEWVECRKRGSAFHTSQVLSGHGCFGQYLRRIGRERTTRCHHCPEEADTAQHTLESCPAWAEERRVLRAEVGEDLSLPAVLRAVAAEGEADRKWRALVSFCGNVMRQKETSERIRRGEIDPPPHDSSEDEGGPPPPPPIRRRRRQGGTRGIGAQAAAIDGVQ